MNQFDKLHFSFKKAKNIQKKAGEKSQAFETLL